MTAEATRTAERDLVEHYFDQPWSSAALDVERYLVATH